MNSERTTPPADEPTEEDTPVGDMTEAGETEVGPYPSLTHVENMEQADLPVAAEQDAEAQPSQDE